MPINTEYFIIERENNNKHPLLEWAQKSGMFRKGKPVQVTEPIQLKLGNPIPDNPKMVDYHSLPKPVISHKIKEVLEPLGIEGIQLIPAIVDTRDKGLGLFNYWYLHVYNQIECMDRTNSISTYNSIGNASDIKKLFLNKAVLESIDLNRRLIFVLKESTSTYLFHQSIVDIILSIKPVGCRFFRVDQWGSESSFS